jgi:hypothetical protein
MDDQQAGTSSADLLATSCNVPQAEAVPPSNDTTPAAASPASLSQWKKLDMSDAAVAAKVEILNKFRQVVRDLTSKVSTWLVVLLLKV